MKRFFNRFFALAMLLLLSPFLVFIALVLWFTLKESPLFIQERIGKDKITFRIYKFKTMLNQKITFLGKVLRKTGIDEIPQLVNIIKGDMAFVGPRPLTQADIDRLIWNNSYYAFRWNVKPGLTGLAQLSPLCHKKASLFWDRYYISNQGAFLNLKIITASIFVPIIGKKGIQQLILKK